MQMQTGENGQKIRVVILGRENRTFGKFCLFIKKYFFLDFVLQTDSEHEHILVIRRKSTIGTAAANKIIQVQVNQKKPLKFLQG